MKDIESRYWRPPSSGGLVPSCLQDAGGWNPTMPTYLALGSLTQEGYDNLEDGPETVEQFVDRINGMGGSFDPDDFYVLQGEYDWAAIVEFPNDEVAAQLTDIYARTGRGRIQGERVVAQGPDGYEEYVKPIVEQG